MAVDCNLYVFSSCKCLIYKWFYFTAFVDINVACKLCITSDRKKIEQVCEKHYFGEHIHTVYEISGRKNHKEVVVVVNFRTGCKFQFLKKTQDSDEQIKISSLKPEISPNIPFSNNRIIYKPIL